MTQAPISVWNEVRFTNDGISISLFSESQDGGAILEDEISYTYDELQEMAPAEPMSLRLSDKTSEALSENQQLNLDNVDLLGGHATDGRDSAPVENLPEVGDIVADLNPPHWSENNLLEVVRISDKSADEYVVQNNLFEDNATVADANPSCDPDETVIEAEYQSGNSKPYAFPESRLSTDI